MSRMVHVPSKSVKKHWVQDVASKLMLFVLNDIVNIYFSSHVPPKCCFFLFLELEE